MRTHLPYAAQLCHVLGEERCPNPTERPRICLQPWGTPMPCSALGDCGSPPAPPHPSSGMAQIPLIFEGTEVIQK